MGMLFLREKDAIRDARRKVLNTLLAQHNSKVGYGPFKGMKLNSNTWWGKFDRPYQQDTGCLRRACAEKNLWLY